MLSKQISILLFFCLCISCHYATKVWLYKNCGRNGFTCRSVKRKSFITYQCPKQNEEYQFNINEFNGPSNIESLTIKNCNRLTVNFRCTTYRTERKNLKYLEISNIGILKIEQLPNYHSQLPPTVVLENITLIESIPGHSFAQIHARRNRKCISPKSDFHSISFRNVVVDDVHSDAFQMPNAFGNVAFINSRINNFHTSSMRVILGKNGVFLMRDSAVENFHPSAIILAGKSVIFAENRLLNISSSGINATTETFAFQNNSVNLLASHALAIRSTKTTISHNSFGWMGIEALVKVGPRSSTTQPSYEFIENVVNFTHGTCLHPDVEAYQKMHSVVVFKKNILPCSCSAGGWALELIRVNETSKDFFYDMVVADKFENMCSSSCNVPITHPKLNIIPRLCLENDIIEDVCQSMNEDLNTSDVTLTTPNSNVRKYVSNIPISATRSSPKVTKIVATTETIVNSTLEIITTDADTSLSIGNKTKFSRSGNDEENMTESQSTQSTGGEVSETVDLPLSSESDITTSKAYTSDRGTTIALHLTSTINNMFKTVTVAEMDETTSETVVALEMASASNSQVCSVYLIAVLLIMLPLVNLRI